MRKIFLINFILMISFHHSGFTQFLNTTQIISSSTLVQNLIGPGIQFSGPSGQVQNSCGLFTNNGIIQIPYANGIIMSTGLIDENQLNDTASYHNSYVFGTAGDPLLNAFTAPFVTYDAQFIEFDFVATSDTVIFEAIFASEEYNEKVNQATADIFRVFLSGPGYSQNTNVTILPGSTIPTGINTINNGQSTGTSTGPCINCNYFMDNVETGAIDLGFDGYTIPTTYKFRVNVCEQYHIRFTIADVFNGMDDSFLLLKGNGFRSYGQIPILYNGYAIQNNDTLDLCQGGNITLSLPAGPAYNWSTGDTTQSIIVNQPGNYSASIYDPAGSGCFAFTATITVLQQGIIQTPVIIQNITILEAPNLVPAPGITYQWNLNGTPLPGATQSTLLIPGNGCYTLTIYEGTCESTSNIICVTNTSIFELSEILINIYPHPITNQSIIETPFNENSVTTIQLFDLEGRLIRNSENRNGNSFSIEKGDLVPGIYILELSNEFYQGTIKRKIIFQ